MKSYGGVVTVKGNQHYLTHAIAPFHKQSVNVDDRRHKSALARALDNFYQGTNLQGLVNDWTAPDIQHTPVTDRMIEGLDRQGRTKTVKGSPHYMPSNFMSSNKSHKARTVAEVVAAEAGGKTRKDRLSAMKDVFSAMYNRATELGKPIKDVVSVKSQFNAYNSVMPAGTPSFVGLAQQAIDSVMANGPTHKGTYYARSYATKNLPKGLKAVKTAVDDHVYYSDPKNRAIVTATGAKKPSITRAALPDVKSSTPASFDAKFSAKPTFAVSKPFSPEKYAVATNTLASASATPGRVTGMSIPRDTASPRTRATLGGIAAALSRPAAVASNTVRPSGPLGTLRSPSISPNTASFTPAGRLNNDVYTPAGGYNVAAAPGAGVSKSYADPMALAAAREWGAAQGLPSNPALASYAQVQQDYADRQAAKAAKTAAAKSTASTIAASVGDTIGGFFDSLGNLRDQTAAAAPAKPNNTFDTMLAGMDHPKTAHVATIDEVMAGTPVKTTTVKPAAIYDDPRALAYAQKMQLQPIDAVLPGVPAEVIPDEAIPQTVTQRARPRSVRRQLQLTVRAPRQAVDPSMPGGTLGGITAQDRFSVGTGLQGITSAMGGLRGATGFSRSNPGVSVTNRGGTLGTITRNDKFGTTTFRDPSGNVTGVHYDGGFGNRLGHTLGSIFGGGNSGSTSGKSSGGSGKSSGKSGGSHSTHSSDSVT